MRHRLVPALIAAASIATPATAMEWEYAYYGAENPGELSICSAGIYYGDGPFVLRLYDRVLDFYLADDSFALPPDVELGQAGFVFEDTRYTLDAAAGRAPAGAAQTDHLFLTPRLADYSAILTRLSDANTVEIAFSDGTVFTIGLEGTGSALTKAFDCWQREDTGVAGINPFSSSAPEPGNSFE